MLGVVGGEVVVRDHALVRGDERRLAERLRTLLASRGVAAG